MERDDFTDYYKVLGLSPKANSDELAQRFHRLAKRYHPDNPLSGNRDRFEDMVSAYNVLKDPAKRADYDFRYEQVVGPQGTTSPEASGVNFVGSDIEVQNKLLAIFYTKRRQNIRDPGVPDFELERIFGCPVESLEFHLWYLKAKRCIERLDNGMFGITVEGVDYVNAQHQREVTTRLLMDRSSDGDSL
jgi:hypothetical protein